MPPPLKKQRPSVEDEGEFTSLPLASALESLLLQAMAASQDPERSVHLPLGGSLMDVATVILQKIVATDEASVSFIFPSVGSGGSVSFARSSSSSSCSSSSEGVSDASFIFPSAGSGESVSFVCSSSPSSSSSSAVSHGRDLLASLPNDVISHCFSFLSNREHFTVLPRLAWFYGRFLHWASSWPPRLAVTETRDDTDDESVDVSFYSESSEHSRNKSVIPLHILARLGRVGFGTIVISGCGSLALSHLANPASSLECYSLTLKMHNAGDTLDLQSSQSIFSGLARMPLKKCSLSCRSMTGGLQAILPLGLPLEDLSIMSHSTSTSTWASSLEHLCHYPLKRLSISYPGGSLAVLSKLMLDELDLGCCNLSDWDLSTLNCLSIKKLSLVNCSGLSAKAFIVLSGFPALEELNLGFTHANDASLSVLQGLSHLKILNLSYCQLTGEGLVFLSGLPLEVLDLSNTNMTDSSLSALRDLHLIRNLDLSGCRQLTGEGLSFLSGLPLELLDLSDTGVTDASMSVIRDLPLLKSLRLGESNERTGNCLSFLSGLPLEKLDMSWTGVTDASLSVLRDLPLIKNLSLASCHKLTGEGLFFLSGLPLEDLNLADTNVTDASLQFVRDLPVKKLKLDLHGCSKITFSGVWSLSNIRGLQIRGP
eukprot:gb/GEZN01002598.1/.p1 GENE.gb/GEZN01002598.1/~~gb/GEZN01002598.1/.p1  ORF type:complete len:654 (-),score=77.72 gb/GEZN01002598.1/:372-2333(-)